MKGNHGSAFQQDELRSGIPASSVHAWILSFNRTPWQNRWFTGFTEASFCDKIVVCIILNVACNGKVQNDNTYWRLVRSRQLLGRVYAWFARVGVQDCHVDWFERIAWTVFEHMGAACLNVALTGTCRRNFAEWILQSVLSPISRLQYTFTVRPLSHFWTNMHDMKGSLKPSSEITAKIHSILKSIKQLSVSTDNVSWWADTSAWHSQYEKEYATSTVRRDFLRNAQLHGFRKLNNRMNRNQLINGKDVC